MNFSMEAYNERHAAKAAARDIALAALTAQLYSNLEATVHGERTKPLDCRQLQILLDLVAAEQVRGEGA